MGLLLDRGQEEGAEGPNVDKKEGKEKRLVLFIIILEERDKKTWVWLAVRRVRMLVGR